MDLVKNKDFIIEEIESAANAELERMRRAYEKERESLSKEANRKLDDELERMRIEHQRTMDVVRRRMDSQEVLKTSRIEREAVDELHGRIEERIRVSLRTGDDYAHALLRDIVESLSSEEPLRIEGPLWSREPRVEARIEGFAVRAHLADGSYREVSEDDILERIAPRIREEIASRWN